MAIERVATATPNHVKLWTASAVLGVGLLAVGLAIDGARTWAGLLLAGHFGVSLAAAALLLIALSYVTGAGWSVAFRRVPESIASALPWMALVMAPAAIGLGALYHWSHADVMAEDPILAGKAPWLNVPFFLIRGVAYVLIWWLFVRAIRKRSLAQDEDGRLAHTEANVKLSTIYLVVYALTFSAASFDWLMSLDPHWFSTMFSVYNFSGSIVSALALTLIVVILLRRRGYFGDAVNDSHLQDLSRLLFGFCCFWAYIWFSQYMLIWYANMPEETGWYVHRMQHGWEVLFWMVPVLLFCVPFAALLRRDSKRSETTILQVAAVVLIGRWLDLYVTIVPTVSPEGPTLGLSEVGATLLGVAVMALAIGAGLRKGAPVPKRDPYLEESLHHHVGQTMWGPPVFDLLSKGAPPPETTVDLLLACHARIRRFSRLALTLATAEAPDEQLAEAARSLCRYFGRALPLHSQDEDISVRPRLEAAGVAIRYAEAMTAQHDDIHRAVNELLVLWELIAEGPGLRNAYRDKLRDRSERLIELFDRHLEMEESHVFPVLRDVLTPEQDRAIVREMRARRDAEPDSSVAYFAGD